MYQLDYRAAGSAGPWANRLTQGTQETVGGLLPGTKYSFRSRGGYGTQDSVAQAMSGGGSSSGGQPEGVTWGEFSVESSYVTSGAGLCMGGVGVCRHWEYLDTCMLSRIQPARKVKC